MIKKIEDCRKLYRDIVLGYSSIKSPPCYLRHLREIDLGCLENKNDIFLEEIKAQNILSEKDVLVALDSRNLWTKDNESGYWQSISSIKDLENEKKKIVSREQIEQLVEIINQRKEEVRKNALEREGHLKISAEHIVRKKSQQELIKLSFFKDEALKQPLFTNDEFDELDFRDLAQYFQIFNEFCESVSETNIKKIATCPFYLNSLSLANDSAYNFYGRTVTEMSIYQCDLFNYGKLNRTILEQANGTPPEEYNDLDKVVNWFDIEMSILMGKIEQSKRESRQSGR